ncbi:MAG: hypothetical protein CMD33_08480 [Flavobacteriales bacterium]|nr:hypothetical protein [Flavobacteriales bacterium]
MKKLLTTLFAVALGLNLSAQTECSNPQDANQDGVIGVDDLMDLLSHWGDTDFDFDGVYDSVDLCTDEGACNYLSNPTEACLYLDAIGACGGDCAEDTDGDGLCDEFIGTCQGESTLTYHGYAYDLVLVGDQCWFAENLRTTTYRNGDVIPVLSEGEWMNTAYNSLGATAVYGDGTVSSCNDGAEGFDACNDSLSLSAYGRLYNWYAVDDARGLCPSGWQVPTVSEWTDLEDYISSQGFYGMVGAVLKSTSGWYNNGNGTNDFGFSALPCGTLHSNFFQVLGNVLIGGVRHPTMTALLGPISGT